MARLFVCHKHGTAVRMGDYHGDPDRVDKDDHELIDAIERHKDQYGSEDYKHRPQLFEVPDALLDLISPEKYYDSVSKGGIEQVIEEERNHYKEGAMNCFNLHGRPKGHCIDFCEDHRRIGPEKKGMPKEEQHFLCHYCPVMTHVLTEMRYHAGLYDQ